MNPGDFDRAFQGRFAESPRMSSRLRTNRAPVGLRLAILGLLIAVAGLATLAKNGQYFPNANPAHQVSISTKLNVASAKISVVVHDVQPAIPVVLARPPITATRLELFEPALPNRTATSIHKQLRSPPLA